MNNGLKFWICVGDVDEGVFDNDGQVAYLLIEGYPFLPRIGEWFEIGDKSNNNVVVVEIAHRIVDGRRTPILFCDRSTIDEDIPELLTTHEWKTLPSPTFRT